MRGKTAVLLAIFALFFTITNTYAHSGRTDKYGGHYDSKTGIYHYHSSPSQSVSSPNDSDEKINSISNQDNRTSKGINWTDWFYHWNYAFNAQSTSPTISSQYMPPLTLGKSMTSSLRIPFYYNDVFSIGEGVTMKDYYEPGYSTTKSDYNGYITNAFGGFYLRLNLGKIKPLVQLGSSQYSVSGDIRGKTDYWENFSWGLGTRVDLLDWLYIDIMYESWDDATIHDDKLSYKTVIINPSSYVRLGIGIGL